MRLIVPFLVLLPCCLTCDNANETTLKLLHVFFRHGSRTPELKDTYPNDPYKLSDFEPMGWGHLTNIGKQRAFKLGKLLRERYDQFLGSIYTPEVLQVNSTDVDRTKLSALLAMASLYRPAPSQVWDEEVSWLPIPYHYAQDEIDYTLKRPNSYCPEYFKELQNVLDSDEVHHLLRTNRHIFQYISNHTGREYRTLSDMFGLYQTLTAEQTLNLTLPEWTKKVWPENITYFAVKQAEYENHNSLMKRLFGGRMLGKVIDNMIGRSLNSLQPAERKIFLYSGHEYTVINILAAMDLYDPPHFPKYSAAVIIELHQTACDGKYAVKVYYAHDVYQQPQVQKLKGCDVLCPLDKFVEITRHHVPANYTAECHSNINLD